jgi:uridine kinase
MPIIGICGGTASGKSTIARNIKNLFSEKEAVIILSDSYYKDHSSFDFDSRSKINFDHPDSIDFKFLIKNLIKLKSNKIVN